MKRALSLAVLLLTSTAIIARADDASGAASGYAPLAPAFGQDTDGVPQVVTDAMQKQQHPAAVMSDADKKEADRESKDRGWLMRAYVKEQQSHGGNSASGSRDNYYYRLSSDKTLATASGLPFIDPASTKSGTTTAPNASSEAPSAFAPAPAAQSNGAIYGQGSTPLGSGYGFSGLHDIYSSMPSVKLPGGGPSPASDPSKDNSALDTPGLTAAQNDPLNDSDLKLDFASPDSAQKQSDRNNLFGPPLPPTTNADLLQKSTDASMTLPTAAKSSSVVSANAEPVKIYNDPTPDRVPQPSPVRQPIPSPLDIPFH